MLEKLKRLRADHLRVQHDLVFYPYQNKVSDAIISALVDNLRITAGATEEEVKKLQQLEIAIEQSRQSGKSYSVAHTCEFILTFLPTLFNRPIHIGIFAAQLDQAKISYNILRNGIRKAKALMMITEDEEKHIAEEENARKLVLPDGSSIIVAPINKISQIEGSTLDLIIIDEAQIADDEIVKHSIWPMGKVHNAPRVYIGKAGTRINYYYRLCQKNESIKVYFDEVVKQRRQTYEQTGDARHLIYEQSVRDDIEKQGIDADEIQREYFGLWQIGSGQFCTMEALTALETERKPSFRFTKGSCFVGIDVAKSPDSSVLTVLRDTGEMVERVLPDGKTKEYSRKKELLNWLELKGENYQVQFDVMRDFLSNYNVVAMAIDSTGVGDFLPDLFEVHTEWSDENSGLYRVKFSAVSKDIMYKNLKVSIKQQTTTLPKLNTKMGERFREQMLDLQQEYRGQLLSVHHPDAAGALDDYCFASGTFILTDKGQINIENIKPGDMVMTRKGYKKVLNAGLTGYRKVITKFGVTATPDHPFITFDGIKTFTNVNESDTIYMWNEKQSSIMACDITDIPILQDGILESIIGRTPNGKKRLSLFIDKFGLMPMGQFLKGMSSIIGTRTPLIMLYQILNSKLVLNTSPIMLTIPIGLQRPKRTSSLLRKLPLNGTEVRMPETSIDSMRMKAFMGPPKGWYVWYVVRNLLLSAKQALSIVVRNVNQKLIISPIGNDIKMNSRPKRQRLSVLNVVLKNLHHSPTKQDSALKHVASAIESEKSEKIPVYNLQVEDAHEYFANNILVHNCDSWALAEFCFAKWYADNEPQLVTVSTSKKEMTIEERLDNMIKDEKGLVQEYWPGLDG